MTLGPERTVVTTNPKKWQAEKVSTVHARTAISVALAFALIGLYTYCISFLPTRNIASKFAESAASLPLPADPSPVSNSPNVSVDSVPAYSLPVSESPRVPVNPVPAYSSPVSDSPRVPVPADPSPVSGTTGVAVTAFSSDLTTSDSAVPDAPNRSSSPLIQAPNISSSTLIQTPNISSSPLIQAPNVSSSPLTQAPNISSSSEESSVANPSTQTSPSSHDASTGSPPPTSPPPTSLSTILPSNDPHTKPPNMSSSRLIEAPKQSSSEESGVTPSVSPPPTNPPSDPPSEPPTKPSSKSPTKLPTNPPTKPPTNPPTEPPTKSPSTSPTSPPTNHSTDPPLSPSSDTLTDPTTKHPAEPPTRPPTESPAKPPTEPPNQPPTENPPEPPSEPPTEPSTKPPTETASNPPLSEPAPSLWTRIPGSVLDSPDKIRLFREKFDCIGREGKWWYDDSPRLLPWPHRMSACDLRHVNNNSRNLAFQNADHLVGRFKKVVSQIEEISGEIDRGKKIPRQQIDKLKKLESWDDILRRQWAVRETLKYRWVVPESDAEGQVGETLEAHRSSSNSSSSRCGGPWERFSPENFCKLLDKRSVLVVGDSISMLVADAIRYNVRVGAKDQDSRVQWQDPTGYCQRYRNATEEARHPDHSCWTVHACADLGFSVRISYVRDYYLNSTSEVNDFLADKSFGESWIDELGRMNISIIVMNRGAHYRPDHMFVPQMHSTLLAIRNAHPEMLMIVRNTPPGHPNCWTHEKPLSEKLLDLPEGKCWNWEKFAGQNGILKSLTEGMGGVYMDVNASAVWRADGHVSQRDCLHYCHPGPVDTWVQLLFNMLLGLLVPDG